MNGRSSITERVRERSARICRSSGLPCGKEKYYSPALFDTLRRIYEKTPSPSLLQAICSLLIKGNRIGREYAQWYRAGVEQDLRVTRLYEYFMNSLDPEEETQIPRSALMYFAYQSNLDQEHLAFLYAYIQKHRAEFPELYQTYRDSWSASCCSSFTGEGSAGIWRICMRTCRMKASDQG